jgi:RHS repeat-associated protein
MGRVVEEKQGEHLVISHYDKNGNRRKIESSPGASIEVQYNSMGDVMGMAASFKSGANPDEGEDFKWNAQITRNAIGHEIERSVTGGVKCRMWYDYAGRPVGQKVQTGNTIHRHKSYKWNANDRLWQMINELTGGVTTFTHDDFGNLASARYEDGSYDYKMPDAVGNLYRTEARTDRKYGRGGRLLEDEQHRYEYDEEGNLIRKTGRDDTWEYSWYGNGMLSKVNKNGNPAADFEYDALGRRTAKIVNKSITRFVWDGNVLLHEWKYDLKERPKMVLDAEGNLKQDKPETVSNDLITWVFDEGTFVPAAKIKGDRRFSIITDYLGTPCAMFDEHGIKTWEAELDIYGKVRKFEGSSVTDCPFRYQGQYEDIETELYYNRFRYYSYVGGSYISADPISIWGGLNTFAYVYDSNWWVDVFGLTGTYIFTDGTTSYIGKGPDKRMGTSMKERVGGSGNVTKGLHVDYGNNNTGLMVEAELMSPSRFNAVNDPNFANAIESPGKKMIEDLKVNNPSEYSNIVKKADDIEAEFKTLKGIKCK